MHNTDADGSAKLLNSTEYLACKVFGLTVLLDSLKIILPYNLFAIHNLKMGPISSLYTGSLVPDGFL